MITAIENQQQVRELVNKLFLELIVLYKAGSNDEQSFRDLTDSLFRLVVVNSPTEMLAKNNITTVADMYNKNIRLREFINRLYFKLRMHLDKETWVTLVQYLGTACSLIEEVGDINTAISTSLTQGMFTQKDIQATLFSNPQLVTMLLCNAYVEYVHLLNARTGKL